jgi:hypothetical protein
MKWTTAVPLLPVLLLLGVLAHALLARASKGIISAAKPLSRGEPDACGYERQVYHTADPDMLMIVGIALGAGLLGWLSLVTGHAWLGVVAIVAVLGAVALDLWKWERVVGSASYVWFQRGLTGTVHQLAIENIRDLAVDEEDASVPTLRSLIPGQRNTVCRLRLRLQDKRIVALPRTDAHSGVGRVEQVANHVRQRKQQAADSQALTESSEIASVAAKQAANTPSGIDRELASELKRLRRKARTGSAPG